MRKHHVEFWDQDAGDIMTTVGKEEPEPGAGQQKQLGLPMPHR